MSVIVKGSTRGIVGHLASAIVSGISRPFRRVGSGVAKAGSRATKLASHLMGDPALVKMFGYEDDDTGLTITADTSMQIAAVSAAVRLLSETLAMLPIKLYERLEKGKRPANDHPLWDVIHRRPNSFQTAYEFKEMAMAHLCLRGNFYGEILSTGGRGVDQIIPRNPDRVFPFWVRDGVKAYRYYPAAGPMRVILDEEMMHLMFFQTSDGLAGMDPITNHRRTLGLTIGAEKYGARFYKNDARPNFVFEYPGKLGDEGEQNINESWDKRHKGVGNAHKHAVLEEGLKIHELSITPENAQFLESRKFQVTDIARIFRVQPHMIGDLEKATFSNIEMQSLEFIMYTVGPWLSKWEQAISRTLLSQEDQQRYYAEFVLDALLRGDIKSRYWAYGTGRQWGWLSANDILEMENRNPIEGGDVYLQPMNMVNTVMMNDLSKEESASLRMLAIRSALQNQPRAEVMKIIQEGPDE